jgi:hypothetical protein
LTGYLPIAARWWTQVGSTNVWTTTLYSTTSGLTTEVQCGIRGFYCLTQPPAQLLYVRFGTTWGTGQGSQAALSQDRDFWYDSTNYVLYVYSAVGNPGLHYSAVAPIVLSGGTVLNLNGVSWREIQHPQIDWFDGYGVLVQGASDHLWIANMAADSEVENGAVPLGFFVHPTDTPVDIHLYNTDANMNYAGYRFDGCGTGGCAFEIKNCRAYANRAYGILDNVQGAVSYDYCHLYANNLATVVTVDTSGAPGPTAGLHNVAAETPPWIREWRRWPAYTMTSRRARRGGSDTYYAPLQSSQAFPFGHPPGATGGAWSWRRMLSTLWVECWTPASSAAPTGTWLSDWCRRRTWPPKRSGARSLMWNPVLNWQARAARLNRVEGRSPMGCIDNFATHAFHGSKALCAYGERWALPQKWELQSIDRHRARLPGIVALDRKQTWTPR